MSKGFLLRFENQNFENLQKANKKNIEEKIIKLKNTRDCVQIEIEELEMENQKSKIDLDFLLNIDKYNKFEELSSRKISTLARGGTKTDDHFTSMREYISVKI